MAALLAGCSEDSKSSEQLGKEAADRIKAPIEKPREASEKARATRDIDLPE
jgi:hypothetical protein